MKILSVDWDYFYPNPSGYDWGATEENPLFYEMIWSHRCSNRNMFTGEHVLDSFCPNLSENFWDQVLLDTPKHFVVGESHLRILSILTTLWGVTVNNLDAHHDMGYWENQGPCCGSWAWHAKNKNDAKINQFYPEWRQENPENTLNNQKPDTVSYELPEPQHYDIVFVCRSGCWTPPWYDGKFNDLIYSMPVVPFFMDKMVKKHRSPQNIEEARKIANYQDEMIKKISKAS